MNLIINANPKDDSSSLGGALAQRLAAHLPGETKTVRVYGAEQKYFNYEWNPEWIDMVIKAERIILPVQMWNFTIPAALKDFFDKITKKDQVWAMSKDNKSFVGLLTDKPVYVIMTSGLEYPPGDRQDFVVPYIKTFFEFMGIQDVRDFRVGKVAGSRRLIADEKYMEEKTAAMLAAFGLSRRS